MHWILKLYLDDFYECLKNTWREDWKDINPLDAIASTCGWNPLVKDEEMTVHYHGKEYVIKRTE